MIEPLIALVALSLMEIVLGIDNIVFISILTSKLPLEQQSAGRKLGLLLALGTRIILLACIFWIAQLKDPLFTVSSYLPVDGLKSYFMVELPEVIEIEGQEVALPPDGTSGDSHVEHGDASETEPLAPAEHKDPAQHKDPGETTAAETPAGEHATRHVLDVEAWREFVGVSVRDLIMIAGGLFLIYNSVSEIHEEVEQESSETAAAVKKATPSFTGVLTQIAIMDIVFSLDSVITAVGMAEELWVMITAVVIAVGVMIVFANQVGEFVQNNPTIKMLALSFLLLIGVMLVAEGIGTPIAKGYIYFAMAFALFVEGFNIRVRKKTTAVKTGAA